MNPAHRRIYRLASGQPMCGARTLAFALMSLAFSLAAWSLPAWGPCVDLPFLTLPLLGIGAFVCVHKAGRSRRRSVRGGRGIAMHYAGVGVMIPALVGAVLWGAAALWALLGRFALLLLTVAEALGCGPA